MCSWITLNFTKAIGACTYQLKEYTSHDMHSFMNTFPFKDIPSTSISDQTTTSPSHSLTILPLN
jgi:hypothetical protein